MLSLHDPASRDTALRLPLARNLRSRIAHRLAQAEANGLTDLTHIVAIGPGDTERGIIDEIGFSPVVDVLHDCRFGSVGFQPYWQDLTLVDGIFDLVVTMGNAGFAYILLVEDREGVWPELRTMCRFHAGEGGA